MDRSSLRAVSGAMFAASFCVILFELLLTRLFGVVLFAQFAHLALALAMLGISIGAIAQHLRPGLVPAVGDGLERRLGSLLAIQGVLTFLAVVAVLTFPVVALSEDAIGSYTERSSIKDDLLNVPWFLALLPVIAAPLVVAGIAFAGVFQRCKEHIGQLYGADLVGGAVGAVLFIPVLGSLAGPDTVFVITAVTALSASWLWKVDRVGPRAIGAAVAGVLSLGLALFSATGQDVLTVKHAAGFNEEVITYSEWTPLARLSIYEHPTEGTYMLLDNTSASEVFTNEDRRDKLARLTNRSLVWQIEKPPGRVAILAASAGPEVAVAQKYGFEEIDAIDIAGEIMDIVAERFPDSPVNPYLSPKVGRVNSDGRAAILHAKEPYDVIQMVHANLWSSAGLVSNAWSPALLETVEAFETYLDKLTDDGTLSFGRGGSTDAIARSAAEALRRRGVKEPWRHMFYAGGGSTVLLVKKRPFTQEERDHLKEVFLRDYSKPEILLDPMVEPDAKAKQRYLEGAVMTDDRPYLDDVAGLTSEVKKGLERATGEAKGPMAVLYRSILVQAFFALVAGILFLGVPFLFAGTRQIAGLPGTGVMLGYVACLGYGYLAVETVLIHELVLFVGHPTYAVTLVLLAMLLSSGVGSMLSERIPAEKGVSALRGILLGVLVLGSIQAFIVPEVLHATALGSPLGLRMAIVFVLLVPLGAIMGMPFPLAVRIIPASAGAVVPWAWALNGWMSVVASLATVVISRLVGYSYAMVVALAAYLLAFLVTWAFSRFR